MRGRVHRVERLSDRAQKGVDQVGLLATLGFGDAPFALDATKLTRTEFSQIYPGPCNEVSNSLGDKHLASVGQRADAG